MSVVLINSNIELPTYPHKNNLSERAPLLRQHVPNKKSGQIFHNLENYSLDPALIQQVQNYF